MPLSLEGRLAVAAISSSGKRASQCAARALAADGPPGNIPSRHWTLWSFLWPGAEIKRGRWPRNQARSPRKSSSRSYGIDPGSPCRLRKKRASLSSTTPLAFCLRQRTHAIWLEESLRQRRQSGRDKKEAMKPARPINRPVFTFRSPPNTRE